MITQAGVIPDGKKIEFIGILTFISLSLISLFIYYLKWKSDKEKEAVGKSKYKIKSVQVTQNGRTFVKSQRVRIVDEKKPLPSLKRRPNTKGV